MKIPTDVKKSAPNIQRPGTWDKLGELDGDTYEVLRSLRGSGCITVRFGGKKGPVYVITPQAQLEAIARAYLKDKYRGTGKVVRLHSTPEKEVEDGDIG
jgi:predicted N-acyltransferase